MPSMVVTRATFHGRRGRGQLAGAGREGVGAAHDGAVVQLAPERARQPLAERRACTRRSSCAEEEGVDAVGAAEDEDVEVVHEDGDGGEQGEDASEGRGQWVSAGRPQRTGRVRYDDAEACRDVLDFCHPYFEGRALGRLCGARARADAQAEGR
eukprot:1310470-Rhodomonas_salina.1